MTKWHGPSTAPPKAQRNNKNKNKKVREESEIRNINETTLNLGKF